MNLQPLLSYVNGRHTALLGLGVSHFPLATLLCDAGIPLTVYDKKSLAELGENAAALHRRGVRFVTGAHCFDEITQPLIFRSPGIRPDLPALREAVERGAELTSEIALLLQLTPACTFGITGSDGKTTTTTLTGLFLQKEAKLSAEGQVFVGGNIGKPLLTLSDQMTASDHVVLELSSFQLMDLPTAPMHAALTNLSPNHLDWHTDMDEYIQAKKHIFGSRTCRVVLNAEDVHTPSIAEEMVRAGKEVILFSSAASCHGDIPVPSCRALYCRDSRLYAWNGSEEQFLFSTQSIRLPGRHNLENVMTAVALTLGYVSPWVYESVLAEFVGVEHRLELVRQWNGVDYYNSSIDSSPSRTAAALSALSGRDLVVICGGYDKKIPFAPLADALCQHARAVVLTGATAPKIRQAILACPAFSPERLTVAEEASFEGAVHRAASLAKTGGCVLLSPACASFDAFRNFAERGAAFKQMVCAFH